MTVVRRFAPALALLALVTVPVLAAPASATPPVSGLTMTSEPGDYVGQGRSWSYGDADMPNLIMTATPQHFQYYFIASGMTAWTVAVTAPENQQLTDGASFSAQRDPFQSAPYGGLAVYGDGRGCNQDTGTVTINQYDFYRSGSKLLPRDIDISFVQHCEGGTPALTGRVVWHVASSPGVHPAANIEGDAVRTTTYGATVPLNGFGPTGRDLGIWFHRAGTSGYVQERTLFPTSSGTWSTSYQATDDYRFYASSAGEPSSSVLVQIRPTVDGAPSRVVRRGSTYGISGTGIPRAQLTVYYHRAGTSPTDYSIVRTVTVGSNGHWSRTSTADTDYRFLVKLPNGQFSDGFLVQAR